MNIALNNLNKNMVTSVKKFSFRRIPRQVRDKDFLLEEADLSEKFKFKSPPQILCCSTCFLKNQDGVEKKYQYKREVLWVDRLIFLETYPKVLCLTIPKSSQYRLDSEMVNKYGVSIMEWLGLIGQTFSDYYMPNQTIEFYLTTNEQQYENYYSPQDLENYV